MTSTSSGDSAWQRPKPKLLTSIVLCGGTILLGLSCLFGYLLTRSDAFAEVGLITLVYLVPACGLVSLGLIIFSLRRTNQRFHKEKYPTGYAVWAIIFLIATPVTGIGSLIVAVEEATAYRLKIVNQSRSSLVNVHVWGAGADRSIDEIASQMKHDLKLSFKHDGALNVDFDLDGQRHTVLIDSYVTGNLGGRVSVIVSDDGEALVEEDSY
ncbi:MAG: hypothetical protein AAFX76_00835 [Planctomycetota bacterium]